MTWSLVHRHPRLSASLLGVVLIVFFVIALPCLLPEDDLDRFMKNLKGQFSPLTERDPLLGFRLRKDVSVSIASEVNGGNAITYRTDSLGRRVTPFSSPEPRDKFLLFFGCSFAFGQGVSDDETLPSYTARYAPDYEPFNYACLGYGPQHMFFQLKDDHLFSDITQNDGVAVYVFITDHVSRVLGDMFHFNFWMKDCPYLFLDRNGDLTYGGAFKSGRPFKSFLYEFLWARRRVFLPLAALFNKASHAADGFQLLGTVVKESERLFKQRYPRGQFLVLIYPYQDALQSDLDGAREAFRKEGLNVVDASHCLSLDVSSFLSDGHPRPLTNEMIAIFLANELK